MNENSSILGIDTYFDKIFYINLKEDSARNDNILLQFQKYRITNFERVEAVETNEFPNPIFYRNFNKKDDQYVLGSLSCRASHLKCIKIAKQNDFSRILILEDDIEFLEDPNKLLARNLAILNDWDMLYFGGLVEHFFRNQVVCAHAYGLSSVLFDDILNMAENSGMEIDNFYAKVLHHMSYNHNQSGKFNIRLIEPFNRIIQNKLFQSNIQL